MTTSLHHTHPAASDNDRETDAQREAWQIGESLGLLAKRITHCLARYGDDLPNVADDLAAMRWATHTGACVITSMMPPPDQLTAGEIIARHGLNLSATVEPGERTREPSPPAPDTARGEVRGWPAAVLQSEAHLGLKTVLRQMVALGDAVESWINDSHDGTTCGCAFCSGLRYEDGDSENVPRYLTETLRSFQWNLNTAASTIEAEIVDVDPPEAASGPLVAVTEPDAPDLSPVAASSNADPDAPAPWKYR